MSSNKRRFLKKFDFVLFFTVIILSLYGILIISSAAKSSPAGIDTHSYVKTQAVSTALGVLIILFLMKMNYEVLGKLYLFIYVACNLLLLSVFLFGTGTEEWGARSWIRVGPIGFQPAEVAKIGVIICIAKFIEQNQSKINELFTLGKILLFSFVPIALILKQPDFGTAMVYVFFIGVMIFVAGLDLRYILYAALAGILSLPFVWLSLGEYQRDRLFNFLDPSRDSMDSGYQALQSKIAVGSGKIFGMGLYNGSQTQFGFLPEKQTDFIFAVVGEELGLIGALFLLILYFIMMYRLVDIARHSRDTFGTLIVTGIFSMMFIHIFQNIGMTMGLTPITGIPLPFMSYGGTFQLTNLIAIGLALNVSIKRDGLSF
ncbi:rod shape-determining protein RodA [Gottschalkia acidurici 9a]|uniref:Peptidoglycan glycosyltransferase RodA n=1 Tax=Gottschalkia acidurici (strain ATCC 7906 / DSM 604 / BCRC 14475 / CIP 104303 / KCTC 5404 / NCIMB 10678 / 9a) TaxID=1128398 RepID=K0B0B3_GOTA9|nr:rod shape-determining protein RodA [Gottschalkia acidurici]AFS78086.1 rod shape-determining protein RodA [Gottschalkia acidurici 9a]